jgi:hypothetical protein
MTHFLALLAAIATPPNARAAMLSAAERKGRSSPHLQG